MFVVWFSIRKCDRFHFRPQRLDENNNNISKSKFKIGQFLSLLRDFDDKKTSWEIYFLWFLCTFSFIRFIMLILVLRCTIKLIVPLTFIVSFCVYFCYFCCFILKQIWKEKKRNYIKFHLFTEAYTKQELLNNSIKNFFISTLDFTHLQLHVTKIFL